MKVSDMHKLRVQQKLATRDKKKISTPLAKEIQIVKEKMIREVLENIPQIIKQQINIALMDVSGNAKLNANILDASNSLLNRTLGVPRSHDDQQVVQPIIIIPSVLTDKYERVEHMKQDMSNKHDDEHVIDV